MTKKEKVLFRIAQFLTIYYNIGLLVFLHQQFLVPSASCVFFPGEALRPQSIRDIVWSFFDFVWTYIYPSTTLILIAFGLSAVSFFYLVGFFKLKTQALKSALWKLSVFAIAIPLVGVGAVYIVYLFPSIESLPWVWIFLEPPC